MASKLLRRRGETLVVVKAKRTTTGINQERIKAIKARLDAAIAEHHRMRQEIEELESRHPLESLREALRRQFRRLRRAGRVVD